jgi:hypothetical protein
MQEAERELLTSKINVLHAIAITGDNKVLTAKLLDNWNRLVSITYGGEILRTEVMDQNTMIREYGSFVPYSGCIRRSPSVVMSSMRADDSRTIESCPD